jgi:Flp pilus assembly pilin Flp
LKRTGQTLSEYVLIIGLVVVASIAGVQSAGNNIGEILTNAAGFLTGNGAGSIAGSNTGDNNGFTYSSSPFGVGDAGAATVANADGSPADLTNNPLTGMGQDAIPYLSTSYSKGFVIVHSRAVRAIEDSYPQGIQLDLGKHKISEKAWHACNCYPRTGISLTFWDFDNKDVLGYGLTGFYYLQPIFRADKDFSFSVRGGLGLSYQTNPHDPTSNPDNQSYSTSVAFPLELGVGLHYKLGELWQVEARFMYSHISNGGLKQPNKGINWPNAGIAVSRYLKPISFPEREKTDWRMEDSPRRRTDLLGFVTYHEQEEGDFLISGGLEIKHARRIARINNLTINTLVRLF